MAQSASKAHINRKGHNWLVYENADKFLNKHIPLYQGELYDLGCGDAPYRDFFLQFCTSYIGVDWAGKHSQKIDIAADLNQALPIESSVADTVVSFSVMEHLSEPQNMLNEAFRILKPGGTILLQVPWQWMVHEAPHDYFRYTPYGLRYLFQKAGFCDIAIEAQSGFFSMWILKFNYFTLRISKGNSLPMKIMRTIFSAVWYLGQSCAPHLDKLDKNWSLDCTGYFVTAKKK